MRGSQSKEKQSGAILILILLFLIVLSFLGFMSLEHSLLGLKMSHYSKQQASTFQAAEAGLLSGENQIKQATYSGCEYATKSSNYFADQSSSWWGSNTTCHGKLAKIPFHYVIEFLATEPCLVGKKAARMGVNFFRITSYSQAQDGGVFVILQSAYAQSFSANQSEISSEHCALVREIDLGLQSWRRV